MEIFINEKSFEEQFSNDYDYKSGVNTFIDLLQATNEINSDKRLTFYNEIFFSLNLLRGTRFDSSLKKHNDLSWRFTVNFQMLNPKSWLNNRIHTSGDTYEYFGINCNDTSVAEVAERKLQIDNYKGLLLNFMNSTFGDRINLSVIKNNVSDLPINVDCSFDRITLYNFLYSIGYILPNKRKFEHHKQKHDRIRPTIGNSILLCSEQEAQQLLDNAVFEFTPFDNRLYNLDRKYNKVIIFNRHSALTYHGYHIEDISLVPNSVKIKLGI